MLRLGSLQLPDAYNHYTLHVHELHFGRLDTGNCSGLHIYTAEGIGCHKSSWQSLGRHIYAEDSSPSAPQIHEYFSVLVSDRHHLRLCLIDRTSLMGLLSAVVTRCTPARWCIQRIHRRRAPSCTSSCSRITDNLMSSSSGLRLLSLSSLLPWPGARSRPRASSYLDHACWRRHPRRCEGGLTRTLVAAIRTPAEQSWVSVTSA